MSETKQPAKGGQVLSQEAPQPQESQKLGFWKSAEMQASLIAFNKYLNQDPPRTFIVEDERIVPGKIYRYLPISYLENQMQDIFGAFQVTDYKVQVVSNELLGVITVEYFHPIFEKWLTVCGTGAANIRLKKLDKKRGEKYSDYPNILDIKVPNALKADGPASMAFAFRNAVSKLGKRFGRDLNRKFEFNYVPDVQGSIEQIKELKELQEACQLSLEVLDKYKAFVEEFQDANKLKAEAVKILDDAKKEGLLPQDEAAFQEYFRQHYYLLAPPIKPAQRSIGNNKNRS